MEVMCVYTASSSGFGDSTSTPASPEEDNPFASGSSTQSQDFEGANLVPAGAPVQAGPGSSVSQAVQQSAAISINTTVNSTHAVFGTTQQVVYTPSGNALAPAAASSSLGLAHTEAPGSAPAMRGASAAAEAFQPVAAPAAQPTVKTSTKSRKAAF